MSAKRRSFCPYLLLVIRLSPAAHLIGTFPTSDHTLDRLNFPTSDDPGRDLRSGYRGAFGVTLHFWRKKKNIPSDSTQIKLWSLMVNHADMMRHTSATERSARWCARRLPPETVGNSHTTTCWIFHGPLISKTSHCDFESVVNPSINWRWKAHESE
ncbi:hypothetical protein J6590_080402 [Homalodisca vitripennis]|nr:hypothetical protein J6590_080402 [Homalodisca vitripennis]